MEIDSTQPVSEEQQRIKDLIQGPADIEWRYEMRRECQEILPNLWLGPFVVSKSAEAMHSLGITHIVCIRDAKEAFSVKPRFPGQFEYIVLDVKDSEEQNLIRLFPQAKQFIDNAIAQGGKVLVHCNGGISISPAFVVMFVMQRERLSWEEALHMLKEYEAIYRASHAVSTYPTRSDNAPQRRKREDDDDDTEDEDRMDRRRVPFDSTLMSMNRLRNQQQLPPPVDPDAMEVS
ncbi:protein-tyrosine phosphatase-like protein [Mucidula mucida]|nr:protein-tyrosine phosphatase-like protein [Mucidula mucida]